MHAMTVLSDPITEPLVYCICGWAEEVSPEWDSEQPDLGWADRISVAYWTHLTHDIHTNTAPGVSLVGGKKEDSCEA